MAKGLPMECLRCGAELPSRDRGCMFCGEPFHFRGPLRVTGIKVVLFLALALFAFGYYVYESINVRHNEVEFLRTPEMGKATLALSRGETEKARELAEKVRQAYPKSGLARAVIAAAYYRDYLTGEGNDRSLKWMEEEIVRAHEVEPCFATGYYYALLLYENEEYDRADELAIAAMRDVEGASRWEGIIYPDQWLEKIGDLRRAIDLARQGDRKLKPVLHSDTLPDREKVFVVVFTI
jgi:tetratricopeptide (TPR) repeat protein